MEKVCKKVGDLCFEMKLEIVTLSLFPIRPVWSRARNNLAAVESFATRPPKLPHST